MAKTSTHEYTESTVVKVNNPNHLVGNFVTVKFDDEEHCLPEEVALDLLEQLKEQLKNKTSLNKVKKLKLNFRRMSNYGKLSIGND